ncbi:MgtC/SapB family protein [Acinetobacter sp. ULE_I057]|uniref:MgtC/SapB family protein n=1 Tax=Acinetobacter sp. ULE_I057 TaxID=3373070 RepID=UPI003AF91BDE
MQLQFMQHLELANMLDSLISLLGAFILGGLIGFERQYRQRTAGLRTNVLVALGAAIFVDIANNLTGADGSVRVIAYVVSGIGFLGAGVIMRQEGNIQGLNTAATLWCSAAVGAAAGCDRLVEAILATIFILAANTLLRPIGHIIDRKPLNVDSEMQHEIYVVCQKEHSKYVMDELNKALKRYHFPAKDFDVEPFGEQDVEIKAILIANSVEEKEIQPIIEMLNQIPEVSQAFWDQNTLA